MKCYKKSYYEVLLKYFYEKRNKKQIKRYKNSQETYLKCLIFNGQQYLYEEFE